MVEHCHQGHFTNATTMMVPNSTPQLPGQYYWSHDGYAIVKLYRKFNNAARNSTDITNPTHQSPHAPMATYLTRPCRAISLHQSQDGSQRSANCDCEVVLHVQRCCSQFNQYHKPHAPITTHTDRHIPHITVPCNNPRKRILLMTLLRLQLDMGMKFLG